MPRTHAVRRHLPFAEAHERLHLAGEAVAGGKHRELAAEVLGVPVQDVAEQHGGLVVEVVAGDEHVVAALERGRVEQVALREPARRARRPAGGAGAGRGCRSRRSPGRSTSSRVRPALGGEVAGVGAGHVAVLADAEADVEPVGLVAEVDEEVPDRQRVLAAGDRDEHPVVRLDHRRTRRWPW